MTTKIIIDNNSRIALKNINRFIFSNLYYISINNYIQFLAHSLIQLLYKYMNFNNLIYNIDILNSIRSNEKLCLIDYILKIDKPRCTRPIYRFWNRQNREKIYLFLIKLIDDISLELTKFKYYKCNISQFKLEDLNIKTQKDYHVIFKKMEDIRLEIGRAHV